MKITSRKKELYIPQFNQNRDLPSDEQVVAHVKHPSDEQYQKYAATSQKDVDLIGLVRDFVFKIENLEVDGKVIGDGRALVSGISRVDLQQERDGNDLGLVLELAALLLNGIGIPEDVSKN